MALTHLERQGFECFLPMAANPYQRQRNRNGARLRTQPDAEPLFPRYLFLRALPDVQNLAVVRSTRGVVGLVRMGHHLIQVPDQILRSLSERVDTQTGLIKLDPVTLQPGEKVQVFDGPLMGAEGILQQHCGEQRALLLMSVLGRETTLEVDSLQLKRAG